MAERGGDALKEIAKRIREGFHPERVILFGSRARGDATAWSDADLLVVMRDASPRRETVRRIYRALLDIAMPKDVLVVTPEEVEAYRRLPGNVISSALREGKDLLS